MKMIKKIWRYLTRPWRLRKTAEQVSRGEIPVDYDRVGELQVKVNDEVLGTKHIMREDTDEVIEGLRIVRYSVAVIRVQGYDVGVRHRELGVAVKDGVRGNPHPVGTGESKQWVRGYCMGACVPPKEWMAKA